MRTLYTLFISISLPVTSLWLWWQMRKHKLQHRFAERLGMVSVKPATVWIHAASVGEVNASSSFIRTLQAQQPELNFVLSTMTISGFIEAQKQFGEQVPHFFFCLDLPFIWRQLFTRLQPEKLILLEREAWPNLLHHCQQQQVEVSVVNGRFSKRSARKSGWVKPLALETLDKLTAIYAQSAQDCQRLHDFGVRNPVCKAVGNMKFDLHIQAGEEAQAMRTQWGERPIWVAGSTHPEEEQFILAIHQQLRQQLPHALCVIAPRHPKRFEEVWQHIQASGLPASRFSNGPCNPEDAVVLLDTLGDLRHAYAAADVCFVAGSVNRKIGGHNILEPAALGKPVLTGQHLDEVKQLRRLLLEHQALGVCTDVAHGLQQLSTLLKNPDTAAAMGARGQAAVAQNQGATLACINGIFPTKSI